MSGIRPTGFLHLGNYFGALRNYVRMQEEYDCYFMVADWHSLTTHPDTKELRSSVLRVLAYFIFKRNRFLQFAFIGQHIEIQVQF